MRAVTFHNIVSEPLDEFDRHLYRRHMTAFSRTIKHCREHYDILPLPVLLARLDEGDPAPRALAITFDDGFAGVYDFAFPVLSEAGVQAAIFLPTEPGARISESRLLHFEILEIAFRLSRASVLDVACLGLGTVELGTARARDMHRIKQVLHAVPAGTWEAAHGAILEQLRVSDDEITEYAASWTKYRKLSADQIGSLAKAGWTIGGHTRTHRPLSSLNETELRAEIDGNFADLGTLFGLRNPPFAYPYGSPELVGNMAPELVRQSGFCCGLTTVAGDWEPACDRFDLGRSSDSNLLVRAFAAGR